MRAEVSVEFDVGDGSPEDARRAALLEARERLDGAMTEFVAPYDLPETGPKAAGQVALFYKKGKNG